MTPTTLSELRALSNDATIENFDRVRGQIAGLDELAMAALAGLLVVSGKIDEALAVADVFKFGTDEPQQPSFNLPEPDRLDF